MKTEDETMPADPVQDNYFSRNISYKVKSNDLLKKVLYLLDVKPFEGSDTIKTWEEMLFGNGEGEYIGTEFDEIITEIKEHLK